MNASQLKEVRKQKGLTQREFADLLGTTFSTLTKWETGVSPVPRWVADKLSDRSKVVVQNLSQEEILKLSKMANERGLSQDAMVAEILKAVLKLALLGVLLLHLWRGKPWTARELRRTAEVAAHWAADVTR
jgi:putative transcriptional regulator